MCSAKYAPIILKLLCCLVVLFLRNQYYPEKLYYNLKINIVF